MGLKQTKQNDCDQTSGVKSEQGRLSSYRSFPPPPQHADFHECFETGILRTHVRDTCSGSAVLRSRDGTGDACEKGVEMLVLEYQLR